MTAPVVTIELSAHAVERFHERVRPALDPAAAEEELGRLVALGELGFAAPAWLAGRQRRTAVAYLVVGDLVLPLEPHERDRDVLCAVTCLVRGGLSEEARRRRNARRRARGRRGFARAAQPIAA